MIEAMPDVLIGNRAYDSDDLDNDLRARGVKLVSPHRKTGRSQKHRMDENFAAIKGVVFEVLCHFI